MLDTQNQRYSAGSTENLSSGPERKSSAVNTITRAINRQMKKERSGSQPNLTNICSDSLHSPPLSSFSPSLSNLSPAMAKIEISRGPTVSVPPVKIQDIPVGVRGSPDGASIRSESPLPPEQMDDDGFKFKPPPRIINPSHVHSNYNPKMYPHGTNQLPHKVVPTQVVMRSKFSKSQNMNKQRHSLPPPPSYSSHLMNSSSSGSGYSGSGYANRKEFALSGHDWSSQMSVSPRQQQQFYYDETSRPMSSYDCDMWTCK